MIQFKNLRQYTHLVDSVRFPQNKNEPFLLVYMSENSALIDDYMKLNIKRVDARRVVVPITKIPITRLTTDLRKLYKTIGLFAYQSNQKVPSGQNLLYDLSPYLNGIDKTYKVSSYRQRAGFLLKNMVLKVFSSFPDNYQKILLYSVDTTKPFNDFINRKAFPFILQMKDGNIPYDHMLMNTMDNSTSRYRLLIKDRTYNFSRVKQLLRSPKPIDTETDSANKVEYATSVVMKNISTDIRPESKKKVRAAIVNYLKNDEKTLDKFTDATANEDDVKSTAIASILFTSSGDINKAKRTAASIPPARKSVALKAVDKKYADELLKPQKTESASDDIIIQETNVSKAVDNKSPEHIFEKRKIDFETNLKKDVTNSFKVLETKDVPLKVEKVKMIDLKSDPGELKKSDITIVEITLTGKYGKTHIIEMEVPQVKEDGTFMVNGKKKCLINQLVLLPISFPKPYDSKFESSYSTFHIWSKRTKREQYLEAYIGSYKLPLMVLLAFSFGFDETLKQYKIEMDWTNVKPNKEETPFFYKFEEDKYIVFKNVDSKLKEELCQSFIHADIKSFNLKNKFGSKDFWNDLIIKMAGRINSTFLIQSNLENIVDPVVKQVLINKQLPSDLHLIMQYMASKVVTGHVQKRNDISEQRIRNSEILVHLAQKQILASYTEYKEQVLSGNRKASFNMSRTKVLSDFINSEIVADMEYANPVEEMATKTRVSPVGKAIGGIPDKQAIQNEGRNVHDSMYGNIDTLDTPEGENVGIVQQLTVDALITSARGLISTKDIKEGENSGLLSTTAAQIPFVENNDGNRVMFGCSQTRQAVPLKNPEPPWIQTGYESILTNVLSDSFIKRAPCAGKVISVTEDEIVIKCTNGRNQRISITAAHLRSGSGKDTLSVFNPKVKVGQVVKEKSIIAEGSCISDSTISLGRPLCVAYMPYKGYNFEDGIVISESVVKKEKLNSLHGILVEVLVEKSDRITYINSIGSKTKKGDPLLKKTIGEIEELIGYDEEEEGVDIVAGQMIKKSPGGKIVDIEVFTNLKEGKFEIIDELAKRTRKINKMTSKEKFTVRKESIQGVLIRFKIEQELPVGVGDKLTNRHGAKGIVAVVEPDNKMPISPTGDRIDVILNPIGVVGRMNMGQMYELYTGLISKELGRQILKLKDKPKVTALLNKVLPHLDMSKDKEFSKKLIANIRGLSAQRYKKLMDQIKKSESFTILIPPFKAPAYKEILAALKALGLKAAYKLKLPEYNTTTQYAVPIGYIYMLKLEHIGADKLHVRSTGPVTSKTRQPTSGKRKDGGQRMGEADTYAFISYNCPMLLSEFFGPLSDDHVTKREILADIIQTGGADYRPPKSSPIRDLLNSYFISLMVWR